MSKVAVTLAYPWVEDGVTHRPDTTVQVAPEIARQLVEDGKARPADQPTTSKKENG